MKDLIEALNRAHKLDESSDNQEISTSQNIEKILRYTQDHIDSFKGSSTNFDWLDDLTYRGVFEIPASCCADYEDVTDEEVERYITKLLSNKKFVQQLNQYRAHQLDEATTSVRVPAAIRDYVDAYCDAINNMKGYNENLWDRGTGVEFFDSGKHSSAYADRVMYGVMDNYELNDDQLNAVYKYVEFQEDAEWYDDSSVTNVFDASYLQDDDDDEDYEDYDDDFDEELEEDVVAKDFNSAKMLGIAEFKKLILSNKVKPFGDNSYCFGEGSTVDRVGGNLDRKTNTINAWYRTKVYGEDEDFDKSQVDQQEATLRKVLESEGWTIDKFNVYTYSTKTFGRPATAGEVIIEANKLVNIDAGASSMDFESIIINAYNSASEWGQNRFNEWQTFVSCVSRSSEYKPSLTNTWIVPWVRVLTDNFKAPTIQFKTTTAASAERIAKVLKQYYPSVAVHHNRWYRGYLDSIIIATNEGNVELDVDPNYEKDIRPGHGTLNVANLKIGGKEIGRIN